jgi:hypothetical protein
LVGFVGAYFWWIVATAAAIAFVYLGRQAWRAHCARVAELQTEHAAIAALADQQHSQVMRGDDRGTYGVAWPAMQAYEEATER